jgi:DNA-binding transcriptional MerR regulator
VQRRGESYLIGQLAKAAGVKADTVRFYERTGLLPRAERTESGYRTYDEHSLQRLRFIKKAQALGFSLDEIRRIVSMRGGKDTCRCVIGMAEATLSETDMKLKQLRAFRKGLADNLTRWKKTPRSTAGAEFCALIEAS